MSFNESLNYKELTQQVYEAYPILKVVSAQSVGVIERQLIFKRLERGEQIKGQECPGIIFIIKGCIKIEKINEAGNQTSLYEIGEGELCHETLSCYLGCSALEITGHATVDTQLAILPRSIVETYLIEDVKFLQYVYKSLYSKFQTIIGHKESMIHDSIEERLIRFLREHKSKIIYMTHQDIAIKLSTSREVVSRKLKQLEQEGILELSRGKIRVLK